MSVLTYSKPILTTDKPLCCARWDAIAQTVSVQPVWLGVADELRVDVGRTRRFRRDADASQTRTVQVPEADT